MNPEVTEFIEQIPQPWQVDVASALREMVRETIPDVEERIQYRKPHFLKDGHYAAVLSPAKGHLSFMIFNTQDVVLPDGVFQKGPVERSTIRIMEGDQVDYALLGSVLSQASSTL
jgi:uncharacterized protein YdhG (YjbR/CyaY superfamily)